MNIRQMQVFHAIMTHGSISEAARALDVAQPSASTVLKHAEESLGVKLFARIGGRLVPTAEAERLFPEVQQLHDQLARIGAFARDLKLGGAGRLAVVANPTLATALLPEAVARFRRRYPEARLRLQTAISASQMADQVVRREFDLGFAYGPHQDLHTGIETLGHSRIGIAMPKDHPLASHAAIEPPALAGEKLITFGAGSPVRSLAEAIFADADCELRPAIEASFSAAACALAQAGTGLAIVDLLVMRGAAFPGLAMRPLATARRIAYMQIQPATRPGSALATAFAEALRAVVAAYEREGG